MQDELAYADGTERYHGVHAKYHPIYRQKLYDRAYYDIFFFDLEGDLIYSVFKERNRVRTRQKTRGKVIEELQSQKDGF